MPEVRRRGERRARQDHRWRLPPRLLQLVTSIHLPAQAGPIGRDACEANDCKTDILELWTSTNLVLYLMLCTKELHASLNRLS